MTLCTFCAESYFDFYTWHREEARTHQLSSATWISAIYHCSICLTLAQAVQQAIFGNTEPTHSLSEILRELRGYPLYQVYLHECAARDQWELEFKPDKLEIEWTDWKGELLEPESPELERSKTKKHKVKKQKVDLPVRVFKVFATYYDKVRLKPAKIDITEKFRQHRTEKQQQSGGSEMQVTPGSRLTIEDVRQLSVEQKADPDTANQNISGQYQHESIATNTQHAFSLFRSWLENCEKHEQCKHLGQPRHRESDPSKIFVPTRLLEVGQKGDSVRRVETNGSKTYWKYATLSHCWGDKSNKPPPQFLLKDARNSVSEIKIESLSLTFKDAILAVQELGIPYIWIDSLCIIQDSLEDKYTKLPMMEHIYTHSFLNIAAAASRHSQGGLFRDRNLALWSSTVQVGDLTCKVIRKDFWDGGLLEEPLYKRAWVLQERNLSPRTIHFGQQVFWQCLSLNACEVMPNGIPLVIDSGREELKWRRLLAQTKHSPQDLVNVQGIWQHLVKTYKSCGISEPSDVLLALNGLVTRVQKITKEDFYAGLWATRGSKKFDKEEPDDRLWRGELVEQLAWRVVKPGRKYKDWCAPSWSWASVDAMVELPPRVVRDTDYKLKLIDCKIKDKDKQTAVIESAHLSVKGFVFKSDLEVGKYHPDLADGVVRSLVIPLWYTSRNNFVSGLGLAVIEKEQGYERIGLIEWRDVPNEIWAEEMRKREEKEKMELT